MLILISDLRKTIMNVVIAWRQPEKSISMITLLIRDPELIRINNFLQIFNLNTEQYEQQD